MRKLILVSTITVLILLGICIPIAFADIDNGYNYETKQITMSSLNQPLTFEVSTDNPNVAQVTDYWYLNYYGDGTLIETHTIKGTFNPTTNTFTVQDTYTPTQEGYWMVNFNYEDKNGNHIYSTNTLIILGDVHIPQTVPEIPLLGTIGITIAMLIALGLYRKQEKQTQP